MKNKKSSKKSLIKFIIIDISLILFVAILFYEFYQSKRAEQTLAQVQAQQEENRKQRELERQAEQKEQEELARQEQARIEEIKKSLPTKFNMRNKIKITAENQTSNGNCADFATTKAIEIALNYQGNYNYDFKKAYKCLKTTESDKYNNIGDMLEDIIGLDNNNKFKWKSYSDLTLIKNELVNGNPMLILIDKELSLEIGANPNGNWIGHALVIIGYDDTKQSWLCLNSWGPNWGNNGTTWIKYDNEHIYEIAKETLE